MIIRVVHIVPDLVPYGLENMLSHLVCSMNRARFQPAVISLYGPAEGGLGPALNGAGVKVFYLHKRRGFDGRMFHRLFGAFRKIRPHIVHSHNYVLRYSLPSALLARVPAMTHTIHNVAHKEVDRLGQGIQRIAFRGLVHPVAIAQEVVSTYRQVYGPRKLTLIPNGIPVEVFSRAGCNRGPWREREGFHESDLLFVCIARFFHQKNHSTLLEAFANGPARDPRCKLILAGDGDLRSAIEAQAQRLGIQSQLRILGRRDDMRASASQLQVPLQVFQLCQCVNDCHMVFRFVQPRDHDEARWLTARIRAQFRRHIGHSVVHGYQTALGRPDILSCYLRRLILDPALRQSMGFAGRLRYESHFTFDKMLSKSILVYDEVLGHSPGLALAASQVT